MVLKFAIEHQKIKIEEHVLTPQENLRIKNFSKPSIGSFGEELMRDSIDLNLNNLETKHGNKQLIITHHREVASDSYTFQYQRRIHPGEFSGENIAVKTTPQ